MTPLSALRLGEQPLPPEAPAFDAIADRYDLLNRILSLGQDHRWRRRLVDALALTTDAKVLDVACGTGDVALEVLERDQRATVVGVDLSEKMLAIAQKKAAARGVEDRLELTLARGERLPFLDASFDAATVAFGIRNMPDRTAPLLELARVVKAGGHIAILELCPPTTGMLAAMTRLYMSFWVPALGAVFGRKEAYRYLPKSIAAFPSKDGFTEIMRGAGLSLLAVEQLLFGPAVLFVARSPGQRRADTEPKEAAQ